MELGRSPGSKLAAWPTATFVYAIHRYTRTMTRTRVASRPSRAIQLYSAIQRYTALYTALYIYSYTSLYTIQPLQHPSGRTHALSAHGSRLYLYYSTFESLSNSPFAVCDRLSRHTSVRRVRVRAFSFFFTVKGADESALGGGSVA